jgi:membrane protease YdiL (CAAX protease family)
MNDIEEDIKDLLTNHPIGRELTMPMINYLCNNSKIHRLPANSEILTSSAKKDRVFFIIQGEVALMKKKSSQKIQSSILLNKDELLHFHKGEKQHYNYFAKTITPCILLECCAPAATTAEAKFFFEELFDAVNKHTHHNDLMLSSQRHQIKLLKLIENFGIFFIFINFLFASTVVANIIIIKYFPNLDVYSEIYAWIYLLAITIPLLIMARMIKIPWRDFGLNFQHWQRPLLEGIIISIIIVALFFTIPLLQEYWHLKPWWQPINLENIKIDMLSYSVHSVVQEFVARGIVLTTLINFLINFRLIWPLLYSAISFSVLHVPFGLEAMLTTLIAGILLGTLYLRHGNLIGVAIVHVVGGIFAINVGLI